MKKNEVYVITAVDNGLKPDVALTMVFQTTEEQAPYATIIDAIKAAAKEYLETETGKETLSDNNGDFNYGDFAVHVPEEIMKKHGFFMHASLVANQIVPHDDTLVSDET